MLTRKVLLLSVAIPLASLPMAASGYAQTRASDTDAATSSSFLVARSDSDQEAKKKLKKRLEEMKAKQRAGKHDQKHGAKGGSQAEQPKEKQAAQPKEKNAAQPPKATHEGKARPKRSKPDTNAQSATDKAKPEVQKPKSDAQQAAPQKDKHRERRAAKPDETPSKAKQAPAASSKDENARSTKPAPDQSAGKPKKPEHRERTGKKAEEKRNQAGEQKSKQPETTAPAETEKQPSSDAQANKRAPLPDQPTSNAAAPRKNGEKPQRLKLQNGAAVFDSEKNADRQHGTNGRRDKQQQQDQSRQNDQSRQAEQKRSRKPVRVRSAEAEHGEAIKQAPKFRLPRDAKVEKRTNNRVILNIDNRTIIQNDDHGRLAHNARDVRYERLPSGNIRQVVVRPNGTRIVTIRNSYGDIVHRSRIGRDGREVVLIYAPDGDRRDRSFYRQPYVDLPPLHLTEPVDDYILDARRADRAQYIRFLEKPPIEPVREVYTLDQVRYSARLRDVMPRIDLDTITFDTGSSAIDPDAASALGDLAQAINAVLQRDPGQIFLIEGHTDAVGSDQPNLVLSDERAESVASLLTQDFDVPPENLVTQGYGEEYLKVDTQGPERANRRVTVRRITPLVRPAVQNE